MKYFSLLSLLILGAVAVSHGFILKEEKKNLASSAVGAISDLKQSALQKKESIIDSVKETAQNKWAYVTSIKDAKVNAIKSAFTSQYAKLAALKEAKKAFAQNVIAANTAKFAQVYSAVSSKVQGIHQYKINLKDKATSALSGAASKVHSEIDKKKTLLLNLKKPATSEQVVVLQPVEQTEAPVAVQTYIKHEPAVVGKVYVPEIPYQIYEQPQAAILYGPPDNTYGPSVIPL